MLEIAPITRYTFSDHALSEMARRQITEIDVANVLSSPHQIEVVRQGRIVVQSQIGEPSKTCLLRVFVDIDREPLVIVTVYRTNKVKKYWR